MTAPRTPTNARPRIRNPTGMRTFVEPLVGNERVAICGGAVKVGSRVAVVCNWKAAA